MRAGRLRHKVVIQKTTEDRTDSGETTNTWSTHATVWASIEPLNGREYFQAQQETAVVNTRIRIRHVDGIVPKMRVLHGARVFDIKAVIDVNERGREIVLMCEERV